MGRRCTMCHEPVGEDDVMCSRCGAALPEKDEGLGAMAAVYWLVELLPGLASPRTLIGSVLAMLAAAPIAYLGVIIFVFGAPFSGIMIAGFALMAWGTGWAWMLYGYVCAPSEALAEFDGTKWLIWILASIAPVMAVAGYIATQGTGKG